MGSCGTFGKETTSLGTVDSVGVGARSYCMGKSWPETRTNCSHSPASVLGWKGEKGTLAGAAGYCYCKLPHHEVPHQGCYRKRQGNRGRVPLPFYCWWWPSVVEGDCGGGVDGKGKSGQRDWALAGQIWELDVGRHPIPRIGKEGK